MKPAVIRESQRLSGFEPDHLAGLIHGGRFEHYILTRARCDVRHERWLCGSFSIDVGRYSFPTRVLGVFAADRFCLGYLRDFTAPTWVNGLEVGSNTLQFYPPGTDLNYRAAPGAEWVAVEFTAAALQQAARERLGCELELTMTGMVNLEIPQGEFLGLDGMVRRLMGRKKDAETMIPPILGAIAELLFHQRAGSLGGLASQRRHREHLLGRADLYLEENLGQPFDARALAAAIGTTERSLQRHFLDAYGITPREWARCLALHRARERLRTGNASRFSIEGIAHDCGFRHMGRFAGYYAELFGELPSGTLAAGV